MTAESRDRAVAIIEQALEAWGDPVGGAPWSEVATVVIDALHADGVKFVRTSE